MRLRASFRPALLGLGLSLAAVACGDDDPSGTGGGGGSGGSGSTTTATTTTTTTTGTGGEGGGQGGGSTTGTGGEGGGQGGAGGGGGEGGAPPDVWVTPTCAEVEGLEAAVTFTTDGGDSLTPRSGSMSGIAYSWSLVALDTPNTLLAAHDGTLLRSTDAGCTWSNVAPLPATLVHLHAAKGGVAYGFEENGRAFFRIEGDVVENLSVNVPFANGPVRGLGLDAEDPNHLRMADETGAVWDSTDGGLTWEQIGDAAPYQCFYTVKFDPNDLDHAICGTITYGAWVTFDGGFAWQEATGDALYSQVFQVAISPVDGDVAWAIGHENGLFNGEVIGEDLKHLWRSVDGGLTWESIADERTVVAGDGDRADLINGNPLYAHPTDPEIAYYTFGMPPLQGQNFAELFRVDAADGSVSVETHTGGDIDDYGAIAFHPTDPTIIYVALTSERPNGGF